MYHGTPDRAGVSTSMPAASGPLRVIASLDLDGEVYASPIVVGGTTVVATENNTVYAFDAQFDQLWKQHLGDPSPGPSGTCGNIDPLGITGTPVYDAGTGSVFVAPEYGGPPRHEVVALDLRTGAVQWRRSIDLPGVETRAMQERGALAITGGRVWIPFGGLAGDCGGYKGRVVGVNLDGSGDPIAYTVPTTREAGIWTPPGPAVDADGNLYVAVGNGESGVGDRLRLQRLGAQDQPGRRSCSTPSRRRPGRPTTTPISTSARRARRSSATAGCSARARAARPTSSTSTHLGGIGGEVSQADVCASFGGTAVVGRHGLRPLHRRRPCGAHRRRRDDDAWPGTPTRRSPARRSSAAGRVWAIESSGTLHALDPETGESVAQVDVGETSRFATPALSGGNVLVGTLAGLVVVSTSN